MRVLTGLWRAKWNLMRLALSAALLFIVASDTGARLARQQLASLPSFDYAQEVDFLRAQGRFGEATVIADAGLNDPDLDEVARAKVVEARAKTVAEQESFITKAKAIGLGALSGQGDSLEALAGAIATDFFIVGDVRDLLIQGGKEVIDGDGDGVVLTLSVVGIITTLAPEIDWVPSLLKAAAKGGHLSARMGEWLKTTIKSKKTAELVKVLEDVKVISGKASPGGAMRLMKHADDPADVAKIARYLGKAGGDGAFALHVAGKEGVDLVKAGAGAEDVLIKAARKGRPGMAMMRSPPMRAITKPHLLVGLGKLVWKGNGEKFVSRLVERLDLSAWWLIPSLAGWCVVELGLLVGRLGRSGPVAADPN